MLINKVQLYSWNVNNSPYIEAVAVANRTPYTLACDKDYLLRHLILGNQ